MFFKNSIQTVGNWYVVFTSTMGSERTFLGAIVIFLNKLHMCLQMKSTLAHGSSAPGSGFCIAHTQMEGPFLQGASPAVPDKSILISKAKLQSPASEEESQLYF